MRSAFLINLAISAVGVLLAGCSDSNENSSSRIWLDDLQAKAESGDARAQAFVGASYLTGIGLRQSDSQAFAWCRKGADQGNAIAENCVGLMYESGRGIGRDYSQALEWYQKATDHKYATAKKNLNALEEYMRLGPKEFENAYKQFRANLRSQSRAAEKADQRPLKPIPCPGCSPTDESGHGAVLCVAEMYITAKAGLDRCYPNQHGALRADLADGIDAITDAARQSG